MSKPLSEVEELSRRRIELLEQISQIKDMRSGTLLPRFRKCGKPNCHCAKDGSPGHGPSWSLTKDINGKTKTKIIPKGVAVEKTKVHIAEFRKYRELNLELIEVSEKLCDTKLKTLRADADATAKKGASETNLPKQSAQN